MGENDCDVDPALDVGEMPGDDATARRVRALLATGSPIQRAMALVLLAEKDER
jgi:hypothetical protein